MGGLTFFAVQSTKLLARVVELMIAGWALKQIAYQLGLSEGAVASYAHRACKKLGVRSRMALAEAFTRH